MGARRVVKETGGEEKTSPFSGFLSPSTQELEGLRAPRPDDRGPSFTDPGAAPALPAIQSRGRGGADRGPWTVGSGPGDEGAGAARGGHLPREWSRGAVGDSLAGEGRRGESERRASGSGVAAGPGAQARRGPGHRGWGRTSRNGFFSLQRGAKPDTGQRLRRDPPGEGAGTPKE